MDINIAEAKTELSKIVRLVETGDEEVVWICRYNKRVAKITGVQDKSVSQRIGIAKGKLKSPENLDMDNDKIADLFGAVL